MRPTFSVVCATYQRGAHIRPTIASALEQRFDDFELIVVADGCADDTLDVVRSFGSPKIVTYELPANSGSQSEPNNLGIARAQGRFIAYLGHDDVWHPNHLAEIAAVFAGRPSPDVVASGCVFHGPAGSGVYYVTGLLDEEHGAAEHFLPPSALAHTRELTERIGRWPAPDRVAAPVDSEMTLRAARAGARFASTGKITVHKFAAGHRYLSYLRPASWEQEAMLSALRSFSRTNDWTYLVAAARRQDRYMTMQHFDYEAFGEGHLFRQNRSNKGLARPALRPIDGRVVLTQTGEPRGLDWHELERSGRSFRWSGPSPKSHLLIPFTGDCTVRLALNVLKSTPDDVLDALSLEHDGRTIPHVLDASPSGYTRIKLDLPLSADDYSILAIITPRMFCPGERTSGGDTRRLGIALGDITMTVAQTGLSRPRL